MRALSLRRPLEEDISLGQDRAVPASAAGKESSTCQCVRSHRYGGIEPPDPVQDQDLPAVQVTSMRVGHTGALTRDRSIVFAFTTLTYHQLG